MSVPEEVSTAPILRSDQPVAARRGAARVEPFTTRLAVLHATRRNLDDMETVLARAEASIDDKDSFSRWMGNSI